MSSIQSFTATGEEINTDKTTYQYYTLTPTNIYPNSTAHPIKADISYKLRSGQKLLATSTMYGGCCFGDTDVFNNSTSSSSYRSYSTTSTDAVVLNSTASTPIQNRIRQTSNIRNAYMTDRVVTLYFTRYDFSASAGTGIASATVSSANGYDGDTVMFTASLQSGYAFDGWYNGSTKVSGSLTYQHTINGADLSLTAKAIATTKTVTTKYNGTIIATEMLTPPVSVKYNGTQIASVSDGQLKALLCNGKLMSGNVQVGNKTLQCANKVMGGDVVITIGDVNILAGKTWTLHNVTLTDGVFSFATGATAMAQVTLTKPIANHKYYGRVEERKMPECTSMIDGRFEYYAGDGTNKNMIFSSLVDAPNDGQWHSYSLVRSMDAPIDGDWLMRNFTVSANGACYRRNPYMVDLTALFGAGNEPDLAWCDANL